MADNRYYLTSSPHFSFNMSTWKIMLSVIIALLPECIYGTVIFGFRALLVILTSVVSCVAFEAFFQFVTKQKLVINNLSAVVSGIMLSLVLPPTVPFWLVVIAACVAMIVAKGLFGGIGSNVFNPALTGRAFLFISFPAKLGSAWLNPLNSGAVDAVSSATVLSSIKNGLVSPETFDFSSYFFGNRSGCIGETSILLILISFALLALIHVVDWRAPLAMTGTVFALTFATYLAKGAGFTGAFLYGVMALFTGGLLFGAAFMVTDYATVPVTRPGRLVFGFGCGLITYLIRQFGGYPEGVMFSILIMNTLTPFLNNLTVRKYGYGKKGNRRPESAKINMEFDLKNARDIEIPSGLENQEGGKNV